MSGGENLSLASQDLQLVKNGVERCLQHYMHKKEAMNTLAVNDNIDPGLTELIWHRLEAENPEFFKAYYLKLLVKDQILEFNRLLSEQVELMRRTGIGGGIAPVLTSNGSQISPLQHIPTCTAQNSRILKTESIMQQQQQANMFVNCASTVHPSTTVQATVDGSISPSFFLPHNPNVGFGQASNGNIPRTEANYGASSHFNFSPPGNFVEARPLVGDACMPSFNGGADSINMHHHHHHHLNDTFLDGDGSSFGFLAQMPQSLGFPELVVADFPDSSDLLGSSYSRPHFMASEANTFIDPPEDIETLDPESGSLRYQSFGGPST